MLTEAAMSYHRAGLCDQVCDQANVASTILARHGDDPGHPGALGQDRFHFMWDDLVRGAIGAVVLVDTERLEQPVAGLEEWDAVLRHHRIPVISYPFEWPFEMLRDAGAEAIQVGSVRVVASSWVGTDADGRLTIDDRMILPPYSIIAIGDSHTLAGAMAIPGGFTDSLRGAGATVTVSEAPTVQVEALHEARPPRYAQPVPAEQAP